MCSIDTAIYVDGYEGPLLWLVYNQPVWTLNEEEQRAMSRIQVFVGLDYHQDSVQVCVMDRGGQVLSNRSCANDWRAIAQVAGGLGPAVQAAVEACSGAADLAEELIAQAGWSVELAHPGYVSRMKQSPDKSDFTDARILADLVRVGYLPRVWLAPPAVRALRRLVRYRQQLVNEGRNVKLRVGALLREERVRPPAGRRWTRAWLGWLAEGSGLSEQSRWIIDQHLARLAGLKEQMGAVQARLASLTQADPVVQRLLTLRGIGCVTAWTLRAEVGRFDRFRSGKQLSRFCGLSPRNASSGTRQADAGLIKAGHPQLRATLIEASHHLIRREPRWSQLALQMRQRGKPASVVAAAVANRWVRWLYHQMQSTSQAAA
jgi:transposase